MAYNIWCPTCGEEIISVTRGIPSMGRCVNGHETDRRMALRRKPLTPGESLVNLTVREAAKQTGVSAATVHRFKRGDDVSVHTATKLLPVLLSCPCCGTGLDKPPEKGGTLESLLLAERTRVVLEAMEVVKRINSAGLVLSDDGSPPMTGKAAMLRLLLREESIK